MGKYVLVGLLFSTRLYFMRVVSSDNVVAWHCVYEKKVTVDPSQHSQQILLLHLQTGRYIFARPLTLSSCLNVCLCRAYQGLHCKKEIRNKNCKMIRKDCW